MRVSVMASPVTGFTHLSQSMPVRGHAAATIGAPDSTRSRWQDTPFVNDIRLTRGDLLEMNGARGADAQTRNALSTAHDALGVIGGLLENVGTVLGAAASRDASFDLKSDQARIDGAIGIIDSVAMSTTFAGKKLLDAAQFDTAVRDGGSGTVEPLTSR